MTLFRFIALCGLFGLPIWFSCGPVATSQFTVQSVTMEDNDVWQLNRPIRFAFNQPIDPTSVNFGSVMLKPTSQAVLAFPVTGQFEVFGKELVFIPACPTDDLNVTGGFIPGGYSYQLTLPTMQTGFGNTVLRDTSGRPLSVGLTRFFQTPLLEEPLFIDTKVGAPQVTSWTAPAGLNLFSVPDGDFRIILDQPIDTAESNLNLDRLYVLFSEEEEEPFTFPATNKLPGSWFVLDNCSLSGPSMLFRAAGILPANRSFRLVMTTDFVDLAGERNNMPLEYPDPRVTPTSLNDIFEASRDWSNQMALDEFQEDYGDSRGIDLDANLQAPLADFHNGEVAGSFNFPYSGEIDPTDDLLVRGGDFHTLITDGVVSYQDSNGKLFQLDNGVLKIHDLTIEEGASLKGEGSNPLVIYATGTVHLFGTLDASGDDATSPVSLSSPMIVEWGAKGQCGGGDGGNASQETAIETLVAESGKGPFGTSLGGGGGGEGGIQQLQGVMVVQQEQEAGTGDIFVGITGWWNLVGGPIDGTMENLIAAGGGGGGFSLTTNEAIQWTNWAGSQNLFVLENGVPVQYDDSGPDHDAARHTAADLDTDDMYQGAEAGLRGGAHNSGSVIHGSGPGGAPPMQQELYNITEAGGVYGMDGVDREDPATDDLIDGWDPPFVDGGAGPAFSSGSPTLGPDGGFRGGSIFETLTLEDDYYGKRVAPDGAIVEGELANPWAGSGGGGSGDLSIIDRELIDSDADGILDPTLDEVSVPVMEHFPDPDFPAMSPYPYGFTRAYFKGAAGGGGGGQVMIFALDEIVIGENALLDVSGGCGAGGEHVVFGYNQISGSGGGSGGHLILHSNTGLDLSQIDLGDLSINQILNSRGNEVLHSIGGRRGWSATSLGAGFAVGVGGGDGNGDFMAGRGGAGANGIIQIHVPNPLTDILFHSDIDDDIQAYMESGAPAGYANTDNLEEVMRAFCVPAPRMLVPFFDSVSMFQSEWEDTGTSLLRLPMAGSPGDFPLWSDGSEGTFFGGIQVGDGSGANDGRVSADVGSEIISLPDIARASDDAVLSGYTATISWASSHFDDERFLLNANLLVGFDFRPNITIPNSPHYQIAAASWDYFHDILTLTIEAEDGPMVGSGQLSVTWAIFPKFFRVDTAEFRDTLPSEGYVRVEFQGADEVGRDLTPGSEVEWAGTNIPNENQATAWTSDLDTLKGKRFFRYRITFDVAEEGSLGVSDPVPVLKFFNIPFGW